MSPQSPSPPHQRPSKHYLSTSASESSRKCPLGSHCSPSPSLSPSVLSPAALTACLSYAVSSTLILLLNKVVFSHSRFHYPWTTLAVQNTLSVFVILICNILGLTRAGAYSPRLARDMAVPITFFICFIFTNALSMRHINIPVLTVFKSGGPMFVTLFERFYFRDVFSAKVYFAMTLIVLSALVTAINDLEYSSIGYMWAAANVVSNVGYVASLRIYLRSPHVSSLDKTLHSNLLSLPPMLVLAWFFNEFPHVATDLAQTTNAFKTAFVLSGFLTTAICASAFWTISLTNGSTLSFIGGLNKVPVIVLSIIFFETHMTSAGWVGVALGVLAGFVFMHAKSIKAEPVQLEKGDDGSGLKVIKTPSSCAVSITEEEASNREV